MSISSKRGRQTENSVYCRVGRGEADDLLKWRLAPVYIVIFDACPGTILLNNHPPDYVFDGDFRVSQLNVSLSREKRRRFDQHGHAVLGRRARGHHIARMLFRGRLRDGRGVRQAASGQRGRRRRRRRRPGTVERRRCRRTTDSGDRNK